MVQQVVLGCSKQRCWICEGDRTRLGRQQAVCSIFSKTHIFFITDPFTMLMLCLGYPAGIGATLAFHVFCNDT